MVKNKKLVIIGAGEFAEIAYEYFTHDSSYEVVAFSVEREFKSSDMLFKLPIIELEDLTIKYPNDQYELFVAITFVKMNRVRTRIYRELKELGYKFATYLSSRAFIWHNVKIGENTFIFENNTIQYSVKIGANVIMWSGNHIGHQTVIHDNCFISSHSVVSGYCVVGESSFLGVNSTLGDHVSLPKDTMLAAGSLLIKSFPDEGKILIGSPARAIGKSVYDYFEIGQNNEMD